MRAIVVLLPLVAACADATEPSPADCDQDPLRWSCDVGPELDTWCVSCHADAPTDFREYDQVVANADTIRCGIATPDLRPASCGDAWPPAEQFPAGSGPHPSDEERASIVDWIDAGTPE